MSHLRENEWSTLDMNPTSQPTEEPRDNNHENHHHGLTGGQIALTCFLGSMLVVGVYRCMCTRPVYEEGYEPIYY